MARIGRPGPTEAQKNDIWQRWKHGQSLAEIARSVRKSAGSVRDLLATRGGIVPPMRVRAPRALTGEEREEISRGLAAGDSYREMGKRMGRPASTISREVARNGGRKDYRARQADEQAWDRARRPKICRLALRPQLRQFVSVALALNWSPEQISAWLRLAFPGEESMQVSHETIYRSLFIQARGVLNKELKDHLRTQRKLRHSKLAPSTGRRGILDMVSIRERPAEAEDRAVPGHWEGDLISGTKNSHVATLVERHSRFVMLVKVKGKDTSSVVSALSRQVKTLPEALRKSLTWDQGNEMAGHRKFSMATDVDVYFCDPKSPWQRGSNENTNGLLRQYLPHGTDLSVHSQATLNKIALSLNQRPRKTLGFMTPAYKLNSTVATTG